MKRTVIEFRNPKVFNEQYKAIFNKIEDTELVLIKCHLLIEFALNEYIDNMSDHRGDMEKERFTFSQKIKISRLFGLFTDSQDLEDFIVGLNALRNEIAHTLTYNKLKLEDLCYYQQETNKKRYLKNQLKTLSVFNAGRILGVYNKQKGIPWKVPLKK